MEKKMAYIAEYRSKLNEENVLVIHVGSNDNYIKGAKINVVMDGKQVPYTMVKRDTIRAKFYYKPLNVFFHCEYQFLIPVTDDFRKVKFSISFPEEKNVPSASMVISGNKYRKFKKKIAGYNGFIFILLYRIHISGYFLLELSIFIT